MRERERRLPDARRGRRSKAVFVCHASAARPHPSRHKGMTMKRCLILPLLLLAGCGEEPVVKREGVTVVVGTPPAIGTDLVPAYPGAVPVEVPNLAVDGTDTRSGNATASETPDSPEQVAAFYREQFAAAGMPIRVDSMGPTGGSMGIGRDGEQGAMLTVSRIGERTRIAVIQRR
jgi:hypothetical protein